MTNFTRIIFGDCPVGPPDPRSPQGVVSDSCMRPATISISTKFRGSCTRASKGGGHDSFLLGALKLSADLVYTLLGVVNPNAAHNHDMLNEAIHIGRLLVWASQQHEELVIKSSL